MCNGQHSSLPGKVKVELNFSRGRSSLWGRVFILFYFLGGGGIKKINLIHKRGRLVDSAGEREKSRFF
jgi:hypothetical protein